jgi:hypothetical protein
VTVQLALSQASSAAAPLRSDATPQQIAQDILYQNDPWIGGYNFPAIRQSLDALAQVDPQLAQQVETAVLAQLTPREQGELRGATYAINAGEAGSITISDNAPSLQSYFEGTASGNAAADRAFYARLDRAFGDGDASTNDVSRIEAGIGLLIRGDISLEQYETLRAAGVQDGANVGEVVLDLTQMTLDIVGIFDQTGLSDGANALISAGRGDWVGAGLSVLAVVPVVGALAAAGKLGKWAETVANNPAARAALEPMLRRLNDAIGAIPDAVMRNLPDEMRSTLEGLKTKLDEFFGVASRTFSNGVEAVAERLGISPERVQAILDTPKGSRPDPSTYMSEAQIAAHLARFDEGAVRFTSRSAFEARGTVGPTPGFVMPKRDFDALLAETGGDLRAIETRLALDPGTLSGDDVLIAYIRPENLHNLQVPSGNELGANEQWLPGGFTAGGIAEAGVGLPRGTEFEEIVLGND